jgi:hypothetical protein
MPEPSALQSARDHLARAEASYGSDEGLFHLEEGLLILDEMSESGIPEQRKIAQNLAATYATKIFGRVRAAIVTDRTIPQPLLEHYFKLMLAFDQGDFDLPEEARALKIAVVRRLIDLAYEGYPDETKRKALARLGEIIDDSGSAS